MIWRLIRGKRVVVELYRTPSRSFLSCRGARRYADRFQRSAVRIVVR